MSQIRFSRLLGLGILFVLSALLISCGSGPTEPNPSADSSLAGPPDGLRDLSANAGPAIQIEKATNGFDADSAPGPNIPEGDPVEWTYVVTNTGGADLSRVSVRDNRLALVGCPKIGLAIGASMTCRANGTARAGQYANLATVTAKDAMGTQVSDEDPSHYFGAGDQLAAIKIEKATNGEDADFGPGPTILVGDKVTWTYVVRNEGTLPLTDVTVTDDQGVLVSCPQDTLAVGETMTCSPATGTAEAGEYMNLGTANATFVGEGGSVSDTDPSHYFGADPQVDIEKATNGVDADIPPGPGICVGGSILWTYEVTNTGNVPLTDVQVGDDNLGSIDCPKSELGPEESMTCTADGTAPAQPGEPYWNKGSVVAWALEGAVKVYDEDLSHYISAENRPPVCSEAFASQETLWPPNHKFVAIEVLGVVDPDGDQVSITIDWIHQDEPVNDVGDGNTSPDGRGVGAHTAEVRAERAGPGNGRVYHIGFTAYDGCDGFCSDEIEVGVPHDKKDVPVDDGATYDSTAP
jgi:hypothetical protein